MMQNPGRSTSLAAWDKIFLCGDHQEEIPTGPGYPEENYGRVILHPAKKRGGSIATSLPLNR